MSKRMSLGIWSSVAVLCCACGDSESRPTLDAGAADAGGADAGGADAGADAATESCVPHAATCVDEQISMLDLFDTPSPALITEEGVTAGEFSTLIDTTGGGFMPTQSFVYARFTDAGLEKLAIDDEAAFDDTSWDIAMRRFVVRVNGGVSGPSCVQVGRTAPGTTFESLSTVPETLTYRDEAYFTASCDLVPDGSGIGAPATALSSFWSYPGCVAMTGNVYVVRLASGRHVKLQVLSYYSPTVQETCNDTGTAPMPNGAGQLRVRWAFLD